MLLTRKASVSRPRKHEPFSVTSTHGSYPTDEVIRIISARKATKHEQQLYRG